MKPYEILGATCTAAMQCGEGKKAIELDVIAHNAAKPVKFATEQTTNHMTILKASADTSRNVLIRSVAYDFMQKTLLLPSQEIKRVQQEHAKAKSIKVGKMELEDSRTNPDTSRGLYCNAELRARARAIQNAKDKKAAMDLLKKNESTKKNAKLMEKKKEAFEEVMKALVERQGSKAEILSSFSTDKLKLTYQHLGGKVSHLPNGKNETYVVLLLANETVVNLKRAEDIPLDSIDALVNEEFGGKEVAM